MAKSLRLLALIVPLVFSIRASAEEFRLSDDVKALADEYETEDIPSELIQAVIWTESRGVTDVVSADGYNVGLMQLHVWYFNGDLTDPANNVRQGAEYLQSLFDTYGDISKALMAYHGEGTVNKPPSYYARSITALAAQIRLNKRDKAIKAINAQMQAAGGLPAFRRLTQ